MGELGGEGGWRLPLQTLLSSLDLASWILTELLHSPSSRMGSQATTPLTPGGGGGAKVLGGGSAELERVESSSDGAKEDGGQSMSVQGSIQSHYLAFVERFICGRVARQRGDASLSAPPFSEDRSEQRLLLPCLSSACHLLLLVAKLDGGTAPIIEGRCVYVQ